MKLEPSSWLGLRWQATEFERDDITSNLRLTLFSGSSKKRNAAGTSRHSWTRPSGRASSRAWFIRGFYFALNGPDIRHWAELDPIAAVLSSGL